MNKETDCLFCKIAAGEIPSSKLYEDEDFFVFLDIKPVNPGHTLVIPKNHYKDVFELPDEIFSKMAPLLKRVAMAVKNGAKAEGVNIMMNNEAAAGQIIFHAHIHISPRYSTDGYKHWTGQPYESVEKESEIAQKIKSSLEEI